MKIIAPVFIVLFFLTTANAQQKTLVYDHEKIFSPDEVIRLDSMLQQYRQRTGKIVLIATDTLDISSGEFTGSLRKQYETDSTSKPFLFMLLMSRKNQLILASVNDKVKPFVTDQLLLEIINAGIPSLKEKRIAEGAMLICKKAMEFLNGLPAF